MGNAQSGPDSVRFGKKLGEGSYGEVFEGTWNGKKVALKKLREYLCQGDMRNPKAEVFKTMEKEWKILSMLTHSNIVKYHTVILNEEGKVPPIIVTELCDCDLYKFIRIRSNRKVSFVDTVSIMTDVAAGLMYLHGLQPKPIVHRDLSSKNILLSSNKRAKITDFGMSKAFPNGAMYATAGVGCMLYAAPETYPLRQAKGGFAKGAYYTDKIDIFSFGAVLLEVIIGRNPEGPLIDPLLDDGEVVPEHYRRSEEIEEMGLEHPLRDLVMQCLDNAPEDRPDAQGLINFLAAFKSNQQIDKFNAKSAIKVWPPTDHPLIEQLPACSPIMRVTKNAHDHNFKVVVLGDGGVGKTSIIQRFLYPGNPMQQWKTTMMTGDHFQRIQHKGKTVHLNIVDTPGDRMLHNHIMPQIYRNVEGVAIVFDVAYRYSFTHVVDWLTAVHRQTEGEIAVVLVGNKTDLPLDSWEVSSEEAQEFASSNDLFYIETSATGLINIDEIFSVLVDRMVLFRPSNTMTTQDWASYNPQNSLLKGDPPIRAITSRCPAPPLTTDNIRLGLSLEADNSTCGRKSSQMSNHRGKCHC